MRSMSNRSPVPKIARERKAPSMNSPTGDSKVGMLPSAPTRRRRKFADTALEFDCKSSAGTRRARSTASSDARARQRIAAQRRHRQRHVLQRLLALLRRHHNLVQLRLLRLQQGRTPEQADGRRWPEAARHANADRRAEGVVPCDCAKVSVAGVLFHVIAPRNSCNPCEVRQIASAPDSGTSHGVRQQNNDESPAAPDPASKSVDFANT